MEIIDNFFNKLYGNADSMMTFYIVLGAIALFFILLIIITLIKSSHETKMAKKASENSVQENDNLISNEEPVKNEEVKNNEMEVSNLQPEVKEDNVQLPDNHIINNESSNLETINIDVTQKEVLTQEPIELNSEVLKIEDNENEPDFYLEKSENAKENVNPMINDDAQVETKPELEDATISAIEDNRIRDDYTIEMPKVRPIDVDEYLSKRESEQPKEAEMPKPLEDNKSVVVSNDELKERLAKLRSHNNEVKEEDGLTDLMKTVGLEDTLVMPKINEDK